MKDKSMINMAGTSMGSYNKPMMKGSGLEMKCGSQLGKYMGGPKMMGGDGGSMPSVKKDNTRVEMSKRPIINIPELDGYDSKLRKIENKVDTSKYNKKNKDKPVLRQAMRATYKKLKP